MKNKFSVVVSVFQVLAILCYIVIIKGASSLATGTVELPTILFALFLAIIFQGLSYIINKKYIKN